MSTLLAKTFHLSSARAISALANLAVVIACSRLLSLQDYATFRLTFLPYEVVGPLLVAGVPSAMYYLLPRRNDKIGFLVECLLIVGIFHGLFIVLLLFDGGQALASIFGNLGLTQTAKWLGIYAIAQGLTQVFIAFYVCSGRTRQVAIQTIASSLVLIIAVSAALSSRAPLEGAVTAKAGVALFSLALLAGVLTNHLRELKVSFGGLRRNCATTLEVAVPLGLGSALSGVSLLIDKLIVSIYGTAEQYAIYVNGAIEIPLIGILVGSLSTVLMSAMAERVNANDRRAALGYFKLTASKTALAIFPLMFYFLIHSREFMVVLYSDKYAGSAIPFSIYLLLLPVRIVVFGSALVALGKGRALLYRSTVEVLLNAILSVLLFRFLGVWGVAIATILATYLWSVPFNLREIANGFGVTVSRVLDYPSLGKTMLKSLLLSPVTYVPKVLGASDIVAMCVGGVLYATAMVLAYARSGDLAYREPAEGSGRDQL